MHQVVKIGKMSKGEMKVNVVVCVVWCPMKNLLGILNRILEDLEQKLR